MIVLHNTNILGVTCEINDTSNNAWVRQNPWVQNIRWDTTIKYEGVGMYAANKW